jgi:exosortase O
VHNLGVDTILIFENGISQVDSPCSGVKSLWTGGLFFLAATWIDRRPLNLRWLLSALTFAVLLLAANLGRVGVLVLVGQVAGWRLVAQMLHVPLGVIGFSAACGAALVMLRWAGSLEAASQDDPPITQAGLGRPAWLAPGLVLALVAFVLLYVPRPAPAAATPLLLGFPQKLQVSAWPLSSGELNWLTANGKEERVAASRWRFEWDQLKGSLLFVTSDTWRAQHPPERCFTVYGLEIQGSQPLMAAGDFPLRWLTLGKGHDAALYSAAYWLQSSDRITEDFAARIWDDLTPHPQTWVLVTVLFDTPVDLQDGAARDLFFALRGAVQDSFGSKIIR